ncbi:Protein FAM98A [Eumeta japonica]|uniref:Protein FAM98A n=1 Tax=Eumeta variegata TaxID=151549 RepID=A0A4C1XFP2_EUMVA|nr:Protein FAM98A [Eumeta japonica]
MENDILDSLNDIGYEGPMSDEAVFSKALEGGAKSLEYTKLVHILAEELKNLCNLEETVNMMNNPDESSAFLLELSSFLKELGCPYKNLITGHMSARLQSKDDKILLLDYLLSELMAARMVNVDKPKDSKTSMEIVMMEVPNEVLISSYYFQQESPTAKDLKDILICLKFNKPPPNITPEILFSKLEAKLQETITKEGEQFVGKPLYNKALTEKNWKELEASFVEMLEEYRLRRETLITRLECTIQSFEWSDRLKTKKDQIQGMYRPKRDQLKVKPDVRISDFLAARTSLLQLEKTSSASVRKNTQSEVNKVIIGRVPDRGGRPHEQQPPPPEMPSWQQRSNQVHSRKRACSSEIISYIDLTQVEVSAAKVPIETIIINDDDDVAMVPPKKKKYQRNGPWIQKAKRIKKKKKKTRVNNRLKYLSEELSRHCSALTKISTKEDFNPKRMVVGGQLAQLIKGLPEGVAMEVPDIHLKKFERDQSEPQSCEKQKISNETSLVIKTEIVEEEDCKKTVLNPLNIVKQELLEVQTSNIDIVKVEKTTDAQEENMPSSQVSGEIQEQTQKSPNPELGTPAPVGLTSAIPTHRATYHQGLTSLSISIEIDIPETSKETSTQNKETKRNVPMNTSASGPKIPKIEHTEKIFHRGTEVGKPLNNSIKGKEKFVSNRMLAYGQHLRYMHQGGGGRGGGGGGGGRGGGDSMRGGGRGGGDGGRGGGRGGRGGGRVQGGYNQGGNDSRPQMSPAGYSNQRNYQTYEVPPGGYTQGSNYNQGSSYNQGPGGYSQGYDSMGSFTTPGYQTQGYSQGYNQNSGGYNQGGNYNKGYQTQGYQRQNSYNEHDDRRGRSNYNRGGRR